MEALGVHLPVHLRVWGVLRADPDRRAAVGIRLDDLAGVVVDSQEVERNGDPLEVTVSTGGASAPAATSRSSG